MNTIKDCPFCGQSEGKMLLYSKNGDMWEGMMHEVYCVNCTTTMSDYSKEKVIEKWNSRAAP